MLSRLAFLVASLSVMLLAGTAANAAPGRATADVNMRTCGSTSCARITTIPAGAPVDVIYCDGWCELYYAGRRGFAYGAYIAVGGYDPAPPPVYRAPPRTRIYTVPPPPVYRYYRPYYWDYDPPRYRPRKPRRPERPDPPPQPRPAPSASPDCDPRDQICP